MKGQQTQKKRRRFPRIRAIAALGVSFLLSAGAILLILSTEHIIAGYWFVVIPSIFAVIALLLPLYQWLFPISPEAPNAFLQSPSLSELATQNEQTKQPTTIWNVPYHRNPFFTGREDVLNHLHEYFTQAKTAVLTQPSAMTGLGGIGKTQIAIEYAYCYQQDYQYVLWIRAASRDTLVADFVIISRLLHLPDQDEKDQTRTVTAVKAWLSQRSGWLLIFDNADDLAIAMDFIPFDSSGHVLVTTRAQATGRIAKMEFEKMKPEEGVLFLLRRAKIISADAPLDQVSEVNRSKAREVSEIMDGLPLALDQAGAYIEETDCSLSDYLNLYQTRRTELLKRRGELATDDHPESVASTLSLSFQKIETINPAAAELLRLCAFLHPDAIPEEIFTEGASDLSPILQPVAADPFKLNEAIGELLKYSLVHRHGDSKTLAVHRLVQAVLKDEMEQEMQHQWAQRAVRAVNRVFPEVEFTAWPRCQRYLPHSQVCATLIEQWNMTFAEAAQLLGRVGNYLRIRAQYKDAEPLLTQALNIREQTVGSVHPAVATSLTDLAWLYKDQGKYEQAEEFFSRALTIRERTAGPDHPDVATCLSELAWLYHDQRKYEQAELLFKRALTIRERTTGSDQPGSAVATSLTDLAWLYKDQGKYEQAEEFFSRALTIREQSFGRIHPAVATSLTDLAWLYKDQGKYEQTEQLLKRALSIREQQLGPEHPDTATSLTDLAWLYKDQGKYEQAEEFFSRALTIREQSFGCIHPAMATSLTDLAWLYYTQARYTQAELLFKRALAIHEQRLGPEHPITATARENYDALVRKMKRKRKGQP